MRPSKREFNQLRPVNITIGVNRYAEGSALIKCGNTHILCTATIEEKVPPFLRGTNKGWVSAEYSMLPRATHSRNVRDVNKNSPNSRGLEIQRLIGRSLRAVVDLPLLGERQITIDCDVLQADGGTRCAAINGGFVALQLAVNKLLQQRLISRNPIKSSVAAVSCGIYKDRPVLDLDYDEDSNCDSDVNFVITEGNKIIEVQGTAEAAPFDFYRFTELYNLAVKGVAEITEIQKKVLQMQ